MSKRSKSRPSGVRSAAALAVLALGLGAPSAYAQDTNPGFSLGPSESLSPPTETPAAAPEHLFGDPGGIRGKLSRVGVDLTLNYIAEVAGNVSGGLKRGTAYAGQVGFEADIDFEKMAGIRGLSFHTVIVNRQGGQLGRTIGDNLNQVQEIYGAGGDVVAHLVYAYFEESLLNGRVDIAGGWEPELNDFSASPLYCNFMNNSLCGNPKTLPGSDIGLSSYPDGVLAGRVRVRPTADTYIQVGAFGVNQGLYNNRYYRSGWSFDTSQYSGVEIPVEVAYEPQVGAQRMPGHYKFGAGYDTTRYPQFLTNAGSFPNGVRNRGNQLAFWALADQMIVRNGPGATDGIILLGGYAHADPSLSAYADQFFAGLLDRDFWPARPLDTIGVLFNYQSVSGPLSKEQGLDAAFGLPYANGATGTQSHQEIIEVNYDIHVYRGVNVQPTFQYYFRPNGQANIKDAAIFGFKSVINF